MEGQRAREGLSALLFIGGAVAAGLLLALVGWGAAAVIGDDEAEVDPFQQVDPFEPVGPTVVPDTEPYQPAPPVTEEVLPPSGASREVAPTSPELEACRLDTQRLKVAILTWNVWFLEDVPAAPTPWPTSVDDLLDAVLLDEPSTLHVLTGNGEEPPTIAKAGVECLDETITQVG